MLEPDMSLADFCSPKKSTRPADLFTTPTKRSEVDFCTDKENESEPRDSRSKNQHHTSAQAMRSRPVGDRFIPLRRSGKTPYGFNALDQEEEKKLGSASNKKSEEEATPNEQTGQLVSSFLRSEIFGLSDGLGADQARFQNNNMLRFAQQVRPFDPLNIVESFERSAPGSEKKKTPVRKIPKTPFKVLDAPALQDDFYLNLLDWSDSNLLAVGLASCVYLWSGANNRVFKVCDLGSDDSVTSVSWSKKGQLLGVGTNQGDVHIWDINKVKQVRTLQGHSSRVGSLAWSETCLVSGSRDKSILLRDVRAADNFYDRLLGHKQEVCGLKWSYDEQMFSSGGNDNKMFIWTSKSTNPIFKTNAHKAAVKAMAWSPHQHGLLCSGGGTADKCIRFWNSHSGKMVNSVDTGSQVCNLLFSKNVNELISTHGYTENQVNVWSYPQMKKLTTLTGHTYRVLYLAMSPDGKTIVTGAGDETLRFWSMFPKSEEGVQNKLDELAPINRISIR